MTLDGTYIEARTALLDALEALVEHRAALVLVGAQAIYLYTGDADVPIATETKDSDVLVDPSELDPEPKLEEAMTTANFSRNLTTGQPGEWLSPNGIPVDLLVPESLAGDQGRRSIRLPPHAKYAARRVVGLEAAVVDNAAQEIRGLKPGDDRVVTMKVAGPTALLVAKLYKVGERQETPTRLNNKDAHDIYRLMRALPLETFQRGFELLASNDLSASVASGALNYLEDLFASAESLGPSMAGAAEELVGDPALVAAAAHQLAQEILSATRNRRLG